jgi:hypothetical protein
MNTVQKNNTITRKHIQEFLKLNADKLGFSDENLKKIVKVINKRTTTPEKVRLFYSECIKKINNFQGDRKGKHLTLEERTTIEILYTARI